LQRSVFRTDYYTTENRTGIVSPGIEPVVAAHSQTGDLLI
jgi:hypothetical protein